MKLSLIIRATLHLTYLTRTLHDQKLLVVVHYHWLFFQIYWRWLIVPSTIMLLLFDYGSSLMTLYGLANIYEMPHSFLLSQDVCNVICDSLLQGLAISSSQTMIIPSNMWHQTLLLILILQTCQTVLNWLRWLLVLLVLLILANTVYLVFLSCSLGCCWIFDPDLSIVVSLSLRLLMLMLLYFAIFDSIDVPAA